MPDMSVTMLVDDKTLSTGLLLHLAKYGLRWFYATPSFKIIISSPPFLRLVGPGGNEKCPFPLIHRKYASLQFDSKIYPMVWKEVANERFPKFSIHQHSEAVLNFSKQNKLSTNAITHDDAIIYETNKWSGNWIPTVTDSDRTHFGISLKCCYTRRHNSSVQSWSDVHANSSQQALTNKISHVVT